MPNLELTLKISKDAWQFTKSGEISPNLVTLSVCAFERHCLNDDGGTEAMPKASKEGGGKDEGVFLSERLFSFFPLSSSSSQL